LKCAFTKAPKGATLGGLVLLVPLALGCGGDSDNGSVSTGGAAATGGSTGSTGGSGDAAVGGEGSTGGSIGVATGGEGGTNGTGGATAIGGTSSGGCQAGDAFAYNGTTYLEAPANDPSWCDAWISATFYPNGDPEVSGNPTIDVSLSWGFDPDSVFWYKNYLYVDLHGPAPTSLPATYALDENYLEVWGHGKFVMVLKDGAVCQVSSGTLTLTRYDPVGGKIEGSYSASALFDRSISKTCPTSLPQGTFSATREPDG
jgi:hypothetical protein